MSWLKKLILLALLTAFAHTAQAQEVKIVKPVEGQQVRPGETIKVQVQGTPGIQTALIVVEKPLAKVEDTAVPMVFSLTIPSDIPEGTYYIRAMAQAGGEFVQSQPTHLIVKWPANLLSINVDPLALVFDGIGESSQIKVLALFAGDIVVDASRATRTTYSSSDPYVVTVNPDGIATALSAGRATITVQTDNIKRSIPATVGSTLGGRIKYDVELTHNKPIVTRGANDDYVADFKGVNYSTIPLAYVKITAATLNGKPAPVLPETAKNIAMGGEFPLHLSFPKSIGVHGTPTKLTVHGSYSPLPEEYQGVRRDFELSYNVELP